MRRIIIGILPAIVQSRITNGRSRTRRRPRFSPIAQPRQPKLVKFPHAFGKHQRAQARHETALTFFGDDFAALRRFHDQPGVIDIDAEGFAVPGDALVRDEFLHG